MDVQECIAKCAEVDGWRPLKKPRFGKVKNIKPEQKGLYFMLKCVKGAEAVENNPDIKEATCGDETGVVVISLRDSAQADLCKTGALLRVQNSHVKMIKGFVRLEVDKWSAFKAA